MASPCHPYFVLFNAETRPSPRQNPGDVDRALRLVLKSDGVERAKKLALFHAEEAAAAALRLPPSEASRALISLLHIVLSRNS